MWGAVKGNAVFIYSKVNERLWASCLDVCKVLKMCGSQVEFEKKS